MSLCVLMSLEQQVDQPRNGSRLPQWCLVGGAQRQVPDQPDGGLVGEDRREIKETVSPCGSSLHVVPPYGCTRPAHGCIIRPRYWNGTPIFFQWSLEVPQQKKIYLLRSATVLSQQLFAACAGRAFESMGRHESGCLALAPSEIPVKIPYAPPRLCLPSSVLHFFFLIKGG